MSSHERQLRRLRPRGRWHLEHQLRRHNQLRYHLEHPFGQLRPARRPRPERLAHRRGREQQHRIDQSPQSGLVHRRSLSRLFRRAKPAMA